MSSADFNRINQAALGCWESLLTAWFPAGRREGPEFKVGSLAGEAGKSMSINLRTGRWKDFSSDTGGKDPVSLLAAIRGCEQGPAARELDELLQTGAFPKREQPEKTKAEEWEPLPHAPEKCPPANLRHFRHGNPSASWAYQNAAGLKVGYICRFDFEDGKKDLLPITWCRHKDGKEAWRWKSFVKPRPLYNLPALAERPTAPVLIVEGEKCADAAQQLLPFAVVLTWPGGCKAVRYADLAPLAQRKVTIWPDADKPGVDAAKAIQDILESSAASVRVLTVSGKPIGWDIADAIAEGWTQADVIAALKSGSVGEAEHEEHDPGDAAPHPSDLEPPANYISDGPAITGPESDEPFRILGHENGNFYYLPARTQSVMSLTAPQHRKLELLQLAPASYWETAYPAKDGADWFAVANSLIQRAQETDFDTSLVRGRGAWLDSGRVIFHAGTSLLVDGQKTELHAHSSKWTYQKGRRLDVELLAPLRNGEAVKLQRLCECFQFRNALDAKFLAGWLALAPICGALEWRPHIWLTGPAGSGKTWIIDNVIRPVLGNCALYVQSVTTEAGIRQLLGCDALPVVFDEAEAEREADQRRMQAVLILARQASRESDGRIAKGTAGGQALTWHVRSTFLFSSIGIAATQRADLSRVTVLDLIPEHQRRVDRFPEALALWQETLRSSEWAASMRARSLWLAPVIAKNAATFKTAVLDHLGNQRDADQIGVLLAGAYSLASTNEITPEAAAEWCARQDWNSFRTEGSERDERNCLTHLLEANVTVELTEGKAPSRTTIIELLGDAVNGKPDSDVSEHARTALGRLGIAVRREGIDIANTHEELSRIFRETPWNGGKWREQLKRIDGAKECSSVRFPSGQKRAVRLPHSIVPDILSE